MSVIPEELRYSPEHQWAQHAENGLITVGITDYAQNALGDVVYIDFPEIGKNVVSGKPMFSIESVKAASDVYAPVSGVIQEINTDLNTLPERVNTEPYRAWLVQIAPQNPEEFDRLLGPKEYASGIIE